MFQIKTITSSKISPQLWLVVQSATRGKKFVCSRCQSVVVLQIDQLIACLYSSVDQQGALADKKREGRCSGDYFVFTVCKTHFSSFIEALDRREYYVR